MKYLKNLIVLVIVLIIGGLFIYQNINKENKPLPEVKLKEIVNKDKSFAIMIQNENGYKEYNSDTWPGNGYKFKEAKCIDSKGDEIKEVVTYEEGKITLTTNKTIYCTVYFDYKGTINILRENDTQKYLSEDLQGDKYRYQASFPECDNESECENAAKMTNWICFGTTNNCGTNDDNVNKYMYRIIGITPEGQLYLLKETFLEEENINYFSWNDRSWIDSTNSRYCPDGKCPNLPESILFKRLNGTSNGLQMGSGSTLDKEWTDIYVDSEKYNYLRSGDSYNGEKASEWYNLISKHNWMYGDTLTGLSNSDTYTGDIVYAIESGKSTTTHYIGAKGNITEETYTWSQSVNEKINLMYIHDYIYSYYDGNDSSTRGNPKSSNTAKNSWLYFQKDGYNTTPDHEWLSTRLGLYSKDDVDIRARDVNQYGQISQHGLQVSYGIRPVFYLESSAKIASGSGTKSNPYILDVQDN